GQQLGRWGSDHCWRRGAGRVSGDAETSRDDDACRRHRSLLVWHCRLCAGGAGDGGGFVCQTGGCPAHSNVAGGGAMTANHPLWWLLMIACVVWYSTITVYVAIRGVFDI